MPIAIVGRGPARDRRHVVPPDDLRVPERRRLLHRQPREPRREPVAGRGRVAARRLHPHGRGVDLGRRRARSSSIPQFAGARRSSASLLCLAIIAAHHAREPARHQGVGPHLRVPDVPLHRHAHRARVPRARRSVVRLVRRHRSTIPFDRRTKVAPTGRRAQTSAARSTLVLPVAAGFSSGAVALTGVEAISNGVPAFRRPESKNAATTLVVDGDDPRHAVPRRVGPGAPPAAVSRARQVTVFAQMGKQVFGDRTSSSGSCSSRPPAILTLAANTAYADFPRLSSIIARDGYLPRQLANRGDRLVFSQRRARARGRGRRARSSSSAATTNTLIPLYAVGVFTSFTLSQAGHGAAPPEGARAALEAQHRDQRRRRGRDRDRRADHRDDEVHRGRVGPDRRDPGDRGAVQGDPAALRRRSPTGLQVPTPTTSRAA